MFFILFFSFSTLLFSGNLIIKDKEINFGKVAINKKISSIVTIKNSGQEEIYIREIRPLCECISVNIQKFHLNPGQNKNLQITLDTSNIIGKKEYSVIIISNIKDIENDKIKITAEIESIDHPLIKIFPERIIFNALGNKKNSTSRLIIKNLGEIPLKAELNSNIKGLIFSDNVVNLKFGEQKVISLLLDNKSLDLKSGFITIRSNSYANAENRVPVIIQTS